MKLEHVGLDAKTLKSNTQNPKSNSNRTQKNITQMI